MLKEDMKNAFNLVSRKALLSECAKHLISCALSMGSLVLQPTPILMAHDGEFDIGVWFPTR